MKKNKNRFVIMAIGYITVFCIISLQLVNLQVVNGKENDEKAQKRLLRNSNITAPRGNIVDRNNIPIAVNRMGYSVLVSRTSINAAELNEMIIKLIKIFEKNDEYYVNTLGKYLTFNPVAYGDYIGSNEQSRDKWIKDIVNSKKDMEGIKTPEDVFNYLRKTKFKIDDNYSDEDAYKIMAIRYEMLIYGYTALNPMTLARDVRSETVAEIEERHSEFPGVTTEVIPIRKYVDAYDMSHVIGYIGKIDDKEYAAKKDDGYSMNDLIGKTGIENKAESMLRGINGKRQVEVDADGMLAPEVSGSPAVPGNDIVLTIDSKLQKVAMKSFEENINKIRSEADGKQNFGDAFAGAAIAMDVNSGEVLAMVSYPGYDPSVFLAGTDNYEAQKKKVQYLTDSKNIPMFNRATNGIYVPGSIFKPLTAIAALEEGRVSPDEYIYDSGDINIGGKVFTCLEKRMGYGAHGNLNLARALGTSCNIYFHEIGNRVGIDNISKWCKLFGLGTPTGIDLPGEATGLVGDREYKNKVKKESWYPADTAQTAIGQMYNQFTPIQIVNYVSSIANGGKRYTPYVIKKIMKSDGSIQSETVPKFTQIPVKLENINAVKEGMVAVVNATDGTAVAAFKDFPFSVAGKTGTPETGMESNNTSSNSLFVCYAPADNPQIAVVVVVERGAWGSNAAPIARDILKEYFQFNVLHSDEEKAVPEVVVLTN